jgi:hypothetical protein
VLFRVYVQLFMRDKTSGGGRRGAGERPGNFGAGRSRPRARKRSSALEQTRYVYTIFIIFHNYYSPSILPQPLSKYYSEILPYIQVP